MSYEFLPDVAMADIAFRASGINLEEVFISASDAVINTMIENLESIQPIEIRKISLNNSELEMLLFDLLQELIYFKDSEQLILRIQKIRFHEEQGEFALIAEAYGEKLDPNRHEQRVDVKAVTLHKFQLRKTSEGWEATVVLDV
jgi:SHS2 domain-containing protein